MPKRSTKRWIHPDENPHLDRPHSSWHNEAMATSCLGIAMRRIGPTLRKRLHRWNERDDVLQEILLVMWRVAGLFDPATAKLTTFLNMCVFNHLVKIAHDYSLIRTPCYTSGKRVKPHLAEASQQSDRVLCEDTLDQQWQGDRCLALTLAVEDDDVDDTVEVMLDHLARLDSEDRRILAEHFFEGRQCREIARDMGITRQAVEHRRRIALDRLYIAMTMGEDG